jgi:putative alpha-1,2-mannosidase
MEHSRRDFLKASGLAAFGTTIVNAELKGQTVESSGETAAAAKPDSTDLAALVNILQGTDSNFYFSHGNTLPIAAMPFGMAHWTLQSRSGTPWMFQPGDRRIQGFRCTHQLSPWLSDYG